MLSLPAWSTDRVLHTTVRKNAIVCGETYTDGKGNFRKVIAIGHDFMLYRGQANCDTLRYRLVAKHRGPGVVGNEYNSTRSSFASWAKAAENCV